MRGKIVNLLLALVNILLGILILIYTTKIPSDITLLTLQEMTVVNNLNKVIYVVVAIVAVIDAIQSYNHRSDTVFNTGYIIGIFVIAFIAIKIPLICILSFLCGIIVLFKSLVENLVEIDSTAGIYVSLILIAVILCTAGVTFGYQAIGNKIKDNENKSELAYDDKYFMYVKELEVNEIYINVKKDDKWGYITPNGDVVIEFLYDYASPFVKINSFDKEFYVALVCKDGSSILILKNGRKVMSYKSESSDINYSQKIKELENIYKNVLKQTEPMQYELKEITGGINVAEAYTDVEADYIKRYDYSDDYDVVITESSVGSGNTYELVRKDNPEAKVTLETDALDYDDNYLYLFSNRYIPFYERSKKTSGWFTNIGRKVPMLGNGQILDFYGENILLRDYTNNSEKVYFIDSETKRVSDIYLDIYVCPDGKYIVKNLDNKFTILNPDYTQAYENKFEATNTRLIDAGLYVILGSTSNISFNDYNYAEFNWSIMNQNGDIILDNVSEFYDQYYKVENPKKDDDYNEFITNLTDLNYVFVGDKFYKD